MENHLIFDFDDTLIYSTKEFILGNELVAKHLEIRIPTAEECINYGTGWNDFITRTWPGIDISNFKKVYKEITKDIIYSIVEGANEALEELNTNYCLHVLSKRPKEMLGLRVEQTGINIDIFENVLCSEDVKYHKPDPRTFDGLLKKIAEKYGPVSRNETYYVGDHPDDMLAAKGAGLRFVGVLTGVFGKDDFNGYSEIIPSVADLPQYLKYQ